MTKSNIYEALALFQDKVGSVHKGKTAKAGSFSYAYADLSAIMAHIQPVLTECKLAVSQAIHSMEQRAALSTSLCHWPSGESIDSTFPFEPNPDPQKAGSQITYYRRYSLGAILNLVTDEDDDAAKASPQARKRAAPKARSGSSQTSPKPTTAATATDSARPEKQCPACGKGDLDDDYPLLQDKENPDKWFHWKKKGGCGWTGNPDNYSKPESTASTAGKTLAKKAQEMFGEGKSPGKIAHHYREEIEIARQTKDMDKLQDTLTKMRADDDAGGLPDATRKNIWVKWNDARDEIQKHMEAQAEALHLDDQAQKDRVPF